MDYLKKEHINFIEPQMWPPNNPDINPVDYAISSALQQQVYHQRQFKTVDELKRAIVTERQKLSQRFIDNSINEWRRRFEAVIKNCGGHIEHCYLAWAATHHFSTIQSLVKKTLDTDISRSVCFARLGGNTINVWKNLTFTRYKFLLVTVKEWLKSVLNYRSYPRNKTGYTFFRPPCRCYIYPSYYRV